MAKTYEVYEILNSVNNDRYVGITEKTAEERFENHKMHLNSICSNTENRSEMYLDMKKFGIDRFYIRSIQKGISKKLALQIERELQKNPLYKRYSEKDRTRDCRAKFRSCYKLIAEDEIMYFKKTTEIAVFFGCHKTNVTRSLNDGYLFLRKYFIMRISLQEYNNNNGMQSLDF